MFWLLLTTRTHVYYQLKINIKLILYNATYSPVTVEHKTWLYERDTYIRAAVGARNVSRILCAKNLADVRMVAIPNSNIERVQKSIYCYCDTSQFGWISTLTIKWMIVYIALIHMCIVGLWYVTSHSSIYNNILLHNVCNALLAQSGYSTQSIHYTYKNISVCAVKSWAFTTLCGYADV